MRRTCRSRPPARLRTRSRWAPSGTTWSSASEKNAEYVAAFAKLYDDGITKDNATDAIAEYEKSLITPSRFDKFLLGDETAITDAEKKGYATFKEAGCTACHSGIVAGGTMFQKMGLVNDYFKDRGTPVTDADLGRFNVTKNAADKHLFKVPTLRNVELTSPYLHDGSRATLEETVQVMGKYQLGRDLTDGQVNSIVTFLKEPDRRASRAREAPDQGLGTGYGAKKIGLVTPKGSRPGCTGSSVCVWSLRLGIVGS